MQDQAQRKTPRQIPASIYLGIKAIRDQRLAKLDEIARELGRGRSELIQAIADGELEVNVKDTPK